MMHSYLKAEGTDKYWVVYSHRPRWKPSEHDGDVLVAISMDGKPWARTAI